MVDALFCPHVAFRWALPPILLLHRTDSADSGADSVAILPLQLPLQLLFAHLAPPFDNPIRGRGRGGGRGRIFMYINFEQIDASV